MIIHKKLTITTFTDPMMGLSYESEPYFRKLETHFENRIGFNYVMAGLVRDVFDFVDPLDLQVGKEYAIDRYNARLAKIYESEEDITGMPINMENLQLFSIDHTSSTPLNLAFKAAQLADFEKAPLFLYNLRYATIVECKPTTRFDEIMSVVASTKINTDRFVGHYRDGNAQAALDDDFAFRKSLSVNGLPGYLLEYAGRSILAKGVLHYDSFVSLIEDLTEGALRPLPPTPSTDSVRKLINDHPLISPIEVRAAFGLRDLGEVEALIQPLLVKREIAIINVRGGYFIRKL